MTDEMELDLDALSMLRLSDTEGNSDTEEDELDEKMSDAEQQHGFNLLPLATIDATEEWLFCGQMSTESRRGQGQQLPVPFPASR